MALSSAETVYLGRGNFISLILQANDIAVSQSSATAMKLVLGKSVIGSSVNASGPIRWSTTGYATGEVRLFLGQMSTVTYPIIYPGKYEAVLVVYGATYSSGLVWDNNIPIRVIADPVTT